MSDIRSILEKLLEPNLHAREYARGIISRYPGTRERWKKRDGYPFVEQIEHMALYVEQFASKYKVLRDQISVRIIDILRADDGRKSMLGSLADKTPPKEKIFADAGPLYKGSHPWAKLMLDCEELSYDNQAEDFYLCVVNDQEVNERIRNKLTLLIDSDFTLQLLCTELATVMRMSALTENRWKGMSPVQRAYALRGILNHFVPEITGGALDVRGLVKWAIDAEPSLMGFIPLGCCATIHAELSPDQPSPNPNPTMSNDPVQHYLSTPVARPTLIYGEDISRMNDEELISATKSIQLRINKLKEIPGNSRKIAKQIQEAEAAMALIVAKLDADLPSE